MEGRFMRRDLVPVIAGLVAHPISYIWGFRALVAIIRESASAVQYVYTVEAWTYLMGTISIGAALLLIPRTALWKQSRAYFVCLLSVAALGIVLIAIRKEIFSNLYDRLAIGVFLAHTASWLLTLYFAEIASRRTFDSFYPELKQVRAGEFTN